MISRKIDVGNVSDRTGRNSAEHLCILNKKHQEPESWFLVLLRKPAIPYKSIVPEMGLEPIRF